MRNCAHLVRAGLVQVHRRAPRRHVRGGEVGPERAEVVADADMVVDHVEQHAEAPAVARVHEPLQPVRAAVGLVHRPQVDAVITPAPATREAGHRHQLDHVHAQLAEVVETADGGVERALRGERADVHLVDHRTAQRPAPPALVGPAERGVIVAAAQPVAAVRLPRRAWVGQQRPAVQPEPVVGAGRRAWHAGFPPAGRPGRAHRQHLLRAAGQARMPDLYLDRPDGRGPQPEHAHVGTSASIISRRRRRVEIRPG